MLWNVAVGGAAKQGRGTLELSWRARVISLLEIPKWPLSVLALRLS